uniref:Ig-like domain-containing protein n=1 Tax=Pygocentrus nattereri TaxID=42514 RepID=A0A3B4DVT7_PYGNA
MVGALFNFLLWEPINCQDRVVNISAVLQPPVSDPVELGGDTTLQCSILTDASAGDHSVYWFRHGSGESHPGIIYTHGNRSDECKKSSETDSPTQSCVYKLPKRNLSLSDAGTYYCAVLLCGEIIFGNGTKLDFAGKSRYCFNSFKTNPDIIYTNTIIKVGCTHIRLRYGCLILISVKCVLLIFVIICLSDFILIY